MFAKRSFVIAVSFDLASVLSVIYLDDTNGVKVATHQKTKLTAMAAESTIEKTSASWTLVAVPHKKRGKEFVRG